MITCMISLRNTIGLIDALAFLFFHTALGLVTFVAICALSRVGAGPDSWVLYGLDPSWT